MKYVVDSIDDPRDIFIHKKSARDWSQVWNTVQSKSIISNKEPMRKPYFLSQSEGLELSPKGHGAKHLSHWNRVWYWRVCSEGSGWL